LAVSIGMTIVALTFPVRKMLVIFFLCSFSTEFIIIKKSCDK
jgi:hypothetical protein